MRLGACFGIWMLGVQARVTIAFLVPTSRVPHVRTSQHTARQRSEIISLSATPSPNTQGGPAGGRARKRARSRKADSSHTKDGVEPLHGSNSGRGGGSTRNRVRSREHQMRRGKTPPTTAQRAAVTPSSVLDVVNDGLTLTAKDTHVLVPVNDVVFVPLCSLSQAAADTLSEIGNSDTNNKGMRIAMDRFCRTLESVCRTDFSTRVDKVNAARVLGGRWDRISVPLPDVPTKTGGSVRIELSEERAKNHPRLPRLLRLSGQKPVQQQQQQQQQTKINDTNNGEGEETADSDLVRREWNKPPWQPRSDEAGSEKSKERDEASTGRKQGGRWRGVGRRGGGEDYIARAAEERCLPLLQLVEDLVRDAMFSPISKRDVVMSQALSAEFPTTARVRPVFHNMADIFDMLHERPNTKEGPAQQSVVPFEGRLLVFKRGNGVEETKGRLLLKKLDYVQSNAVRWLSQSVTDKIKRLQEQSLDFVSSRSRALSRRKEAALNCFVDRAVEFGIERDTLARFLPVTNATELAVKDMLDEALRANDQRARVSLRRYGTRDVNVELEEFSEGGAWPPGDNSWFWDTRKVVPALTGDAKQSITEKTESRASAVASGQGVRSTALPRVTLGSLLSRQALERNEATAKLPRQTPGRSHASTARWIGQKAKERRHASMLSRLLSTCTIKEPTYEEVVVVYYKKRRDSLRPPKRLAFAWDFGARLGRLGFGKKENKQSNVALNPSDEPEDPDLGLQLRVYRGVPLVNLNAITPDKRVEVRPQTALRLDLTSVVGLGLVLANIRFDSPVLVVAATASVVLFIIRTVVGYLNTRIRVESFVSRDMLAKTMGSNVPVLRHLAEEAAQQKSRHVALVYAALLQCALDDEEKKQGSSAEEGRREEWERGARGVTSIASISRHCGAIMKACVGVDWDAEIDVWHWLQEMEELKIIARTEEDTRGDGVDNQDPRTLPVALEGPATTGRRPGINHLQTDEYTGPTTATTAVAATTTRSFPASTSHDAAATTAVRLAEACESRTVHSSAMSGDEASGGVGGDGGAETTSVVFYRLLTPEAAAEELSIRWAELVEPDNGVEAIAASDIQRIAGRSGENGGPAAVDVGLDGDVDIGSGGRNSDMGGFPGSAGSKLSSCVTSGLEREGGGDKVTSGDDDDVKSTYSDRYAGGTTSAKNAVDDAFAGESDPSVDRNLKRNTVAAVAVSSANESVGDDDDGYDGGGLL